MKKIMTIVGAMAIAATLAVGSGFAQQQPDQKKQDTVTSSTPGKTTPDGSKSCVRHTGRHHAKGAALHKHHQRMANTSEKSTPAVTKKDAKPAVSAKSDEKAAPSVTKKDESPAVTSKPADKTAPATGKIGENSSVTKGGEKTAPPASPTDAKAVQPKPAQ